MYAVQSVTRGFEIAKPHVRFGERFENFNLLDIMRAFVDVRDMRCAVEGPLGEVWTAIAKMRGAETLQRIDQLFIEAVIDDFQNLDCRCEILDSSRELLVV